MQTYHLTLKSEVSKSFYAIRAAQSLDINTEEKSTHEFSVTADLDNDYNIGLIVGSSGSGKTTLAKHIFGEFKTCLDLSRAVIDQFPSTMDYESRASALNGIGLTSVPCWIKPAHTLSNGQRARAEAALSLCAMEGNNPVVIDEWTSVVDRTVGKVMSHCVQKFARRFNKKIILVGCHFDVVEWLQPDWIIDCNSQRFIDRRGLRLERSERLGFEIREVTRRSWTSFSKYHYLSKEMSRGKSYCYGLFTNSDQIGFMCFTNYMPIRVGQLPIFHSNRVVIHPDYAGLGLGIRFVNECSKDLFDQYRGKIDLRAAFSSTPMYRARVRDKKNWECIKIDRRIGKMPEAGEKMGRKTGFRENLKFYSFKYIGGGNKQWT